MFRKTALGLTFLLLFSTIPSQLNAEQAGGADNATDAAKSAGSANSADSARSAAVEKSDDAAKSEELVKHLDDTNFEKTVKESKVPVLVDFYATWCEPCKRMAPRLEELAKEFEGKLLVVKVDVDRCPKMKTKYGITRLPTLYLLKPGGATQKSSSGERSLDGLREFVKDAVKP